MSILVQGLRSLLVVCCIMLCGQAKADNEAKAASYDFISSGGRLVLKDGDFSIIPPKDWEVFSTHPSLTLLMQVPHTESMKYQRTIQVASFGGNKYIDEVTAREFEDVIVRKFSQLTNSIEEYKVREHRIVDMEDGRDGILFYTEFQLEGINMMQAHILLSSASRHYLLTYTDLADHFEKEEFSQFLNEAWGSMISVELAGGGGATLLKRIGLGKFTRFQELIYLGFGLTGLMLLLLGVKFVRKIFTGNRLSDYTGGGGRDHDPRDHVSLQPRTSHQESSRANGTYHPDSAHPSHNGTLSHSQPVRSSTPATRGPKPTGRPQESRLETAEADDEDNGMDTFFGDEDEEDKAV